MQKRMQGVANEIVEGMKSAAKNSSQSAVVTMQRKESGEVEVYALDDIVVEKQRMAEYDQAHFNAELIKERQHDIEQIETLMTNLYTLTKEVADVVDAQDEKFVRIEASARSTNMYSKKAVKEVASANENRGVANSKM